MTKRARARCAASIVAGALAWLGGCASDPTEISVTVEIEAPASESEAGARSFETNLGVRVVLTRGFLSTGSVELLGCDAQAAGGATWLAPLLMRAARAHVTTTPTRLGAPVVESLLAPSGERTALGRLHPPAGAYCKVKHAIFIADADAAGLPDDGVMRGKSLFVEGTYTSPGRETRPFRLTSTASFDVESVVDATTLSIDGDHEARVVLFKTDERWFDDVDFTADENDAARRVLENLRGSLAARVE